MQEKCKSSGVPPSGGALQRGNVQEADLGAATNETAANWPYLRLTLPEGADPELAGLLTQAAADAGALGSLTEGNSLVLYLPREADEAQLEAAIAAVRAEAAALGWAEPALDLGSLADQPWATAWKSDFKPLAVGRGLLIRPDWERDTPTPEEWIGRATLWVRPGGGFGTGRHETTRLALELLESHLEPGTRVLDFGSGSGILSIAAVRLGASSVTAVELDPDANVNARENFALNGVAHRIDLREAGAPAAEWESFGLIVANMLPHELLPRLEGLVARLNPEGASLVVSGFLLEQRREIEAAMARAGLLVHGFAQEGEWGALVCAPAHRVNVDD